MQTTKKEQYRALAAIGMSQLDIAKLFGVTRQAVNAGIVGYARIPFSIAEFIRRRDGGKCSLCSSECLRCAIINPKKPMTFDNVGLICSKCLPKFRASQRALKIPNKCKLPGCTLETEGARFYCSEVHKEEAKKRRHEDRLEAWNNATERKCSKCGITKPIYEFYTTKKYVGTTYGSRMVRYPQCKVCHGNAMKLRAQRIMADKTSPEYLRYREIQRLASIKHQAKRRANPELYSNVLEAQRRRYHEKMAKVRAERERKRKELVEDPRFKELVAKIRGRI